MEVQQVKLIISSENTTLTKDLKDFLSPKFNLKTFYMDYIPGHGESKNELMKTKSDLSSINSVIREPSKILYARSYSAFDKKGWDTIKSSFKNNEVYISTESIINQLHKHNAKNIFLISPYNQYRHDYEIKWLRNFGFKVIGSVALGRTGGPAIASTPRDMILNSNKVAQMSDADCIYIACTILPTLPIINELKGEIPVITAASAMLSEAGIIN